MARGTGAGTKSYLGVWKVLGPVGRCAGAQGGAGRGLWLRKWLSLAGSCVPGAQFRGQVAGLKPVAAHSGAQGELGKGSGGLQAALPAVACLALHSGGRWLF
jgi:hypothetical protein